MSYKIERKLEKIADNFFIPLFAQKTRAKKQFDVTLSQKRTIYETMNSVFSLVHEI